ncbi:SusC/RagA family TonB-linked outer membrane protein [Mucilaginibacter paludis]|uniref:TonB-dependent receptor plug n=1 Tax=Mucilaginibacter paludis DSM 18603 TaxID=714943 RepID=H1YEQ3_9SPHI|nr:SusC/RagA family TonB-linked outer membrane protein [Mucilaginibacter paludis]EHQ30813.1 TonB-dependent receptor plug [Mucilaginibacter paludis DSM 18603]
MRKILLLFSVLLLMSSALKAQNRTITGVVTDEKGETLPGVTVQIKGSTNGTVTDMRGKYSIKVTNLQNVVIGVKFLGYAYQEVNLKPGVTVADFKLNQTANALSQVEVVAVGYGTIAKAKVLGSVAEIKAAEIEDLPVANLGTSLMNRIAGVGVSVASGKPGASTTLTLQGAYSVASGSFGITTDPLYIIDGLIAQKTDFDNLDASLIESISFLKDAQAAIYGAAADKGVVLVTTKKGKAGKPQISYTGYFGVSDAVQRPKLMSGIQLAQTINDALTAANAANTSKFSQADLDFIASNPYESWYDQLWHSSQTKRHTVNVTGGTERVTFFGGGSFYEEGGNFGTTTVRKYNIRSGMTAKVTDDLTAYISLNTNYDSSLRNTAKSDNNDTENITYTAINQVAPWIPLSINGLPTYWNGPSAVGGAFNPLAYFNNNNYTRTNNQSLNLNSSIEYRPHFIKGLTAKIQYGKNNYSTDGKNYYSTYNTYQFTSTGQNGALYSLPYTSVKTIANNAQIFLSSGSTSQYELIGSLNYARTFKSHNFDLLFVGTQNESTQNSYQIYRTNQQIPGVDQWFAFDPSTTTSQTVSTVESGNIGYVGRLNYDYKGKYLVQLIDRIDGSANFAPGKRFGSSPAAAIGWRVSEEDFFKKYLGKYISSFKVRYNIGVTGDDRVNAFLYKDRFTTYSGTTLYGSTVANGLTGNILPNPDITWEHSRAQTLGFDVGLFNDKLTITAEVWSKHYYDGLVNISATTYPATLGVSGAPINYNEANTWGETFTVGYATQVSKNWGINANINFGWGNSQLTKALYGPAQLGVVNQDNLITLGELSNTYNGTNYGLIATGIIRTQAELNAILAKNPNYTIDGKVPQVGWMNYKDINGDGKIDETSDQTYMYDSTAPIFSSGITLGATYKAFKFNINMFLQLGGKVTVPDRTAPASATSNSSQSLNQPFFWADHWTPSNPNAAYPRSDSPLINDNSTFWIRSGTRWYINNASLSYALPKALGDKFKIPNLRFILTGQNLWTIINPYNYKDVRQSGLSYYPTLRTYSLGVNLSL